MDLMATILKGIRIGQKENKNYKAVKVWDKREFKNLDKDVEIGTRKYKSRVKKIKKIC
jgi:uncharacterized protein with von Willebrand factor type A (vWA) domain